MTKLKSAHIIYTIALPRDVCIYSSSGMSISTLSIAPLAV